MADLHSNHRASITWLLSNSHKMIKTSLAVTQPRVTSISPHLTTDAGTETLYSLNGDSEALYGIPGYSVTIYGRIGQDLYGTTGYI